jgi:SAM-dependent methyltransferase
MDRHVWNVPEVMDAVGPGGNLRNYLEQRDLRRCLAAAAALRPIRRACDVGCGYGRLTMVLAEFAAEVVGFEREPAFVAEATRLLPSIDFVQLDSLRELPQSTASFDFAMTFTVLQHMHDPEARDVLEEVKRLAKNGFVLLTEETDSALGEAAADGAGVTIGRPERVYVEWMKPFEQILRFPRQIEPGYPRANVGTYMLFADRSS